jgi:ABC-type microcin C transport system permease subunit YejB
MRDDVMHKVRVQLSIGSWRVFAVLIAAILVGCRPQSSADGNMDVLIGSSVTTLGEFMTSFARSVLAAWLF